MRNKKIIISLTFLIGLASSQVYAANCSWSWLAKAARASIIPVQQRHFEGNQAMTWAIVPNPPPKMVTKGQYDEYLFEMVNDFGYSVPVFVWTTQGECDISSSRLHVAWDRGDDG